MTQKLFLSGEPGVGKTTIFQTVLQHYQDEAIGFYTAEMRDNGARIGFNIVPINLPLESGPLAHVDLPKDLSVSKYGVDLTHLERTVTTIDKADKTGKLLVLDEIGLMEAFSEPFKEFIDQTLQDPSVRVLATITLADEPWINDIKTRYQDTIPTLVATRDNRNDLPAAIIHRLALTT